MAADDSERMDALTEAILRLRKRQEETERRLAGIEQALGIALPAPRTAPPAASIAQTPPAPAPSTSPPPARPETAHLETNVGLAWINRIGAVTLALGVAFGFKYASDNGWIGPGVRVTLGVLAGFVAVFAADRTSRSGQKTYAQGIFGLGIAILYLSFYASFGFYHLAPAGVAFALMALDTGLAAAISLRYDTSAIAMLGLLGGYATPLLLSTGDDRPWALFTWVLVLNAGALAVAKARQWRNLDTLAFLASVVLYSGWLSSRFAPEKQLVAVLFAFVYYGLFSASGPAWIFYLSQILVALSLTVIWNQALIPYELASLVVAAAGLAISDLRGRRMGARIVAAAFWFAYFEWASDFRRPPAPVPVFLFLTAAFLIFLCWLPWRALYREGASAAQDAAAMTLYSAVYFAASYDLVWKDHRGWVGLFGVGVAAALWLAAHRIRTGWQAAAVYLGGHSIILWALGCQVTGWVELNVTQDRGSAESAAISILMAVYGVFLIGTGVLYRFAINRLAGLGLIGLVVAKLYLYDIWLLDRIYRIAAFGALGALLLLISYMYSRNRAAIESWWKDRKRES